MTFTGLGHHLRHIQPFPCSSAGVGCFSYETRKGRSHGDKRGARRRCSAALSSGDKSLIAALNYIQDNKNWATEKTEKLDRIILYCLLFLINSILKILFHFFDGCLSSALTSDNHLNSSWLLNVMFCPGCAAPLSDFPFVKLSI